MKQMLWVPFFALTILATACVSTGSDFPDAIPASLRTITEDDKNLYNTLMSMEPVAADPLLLALSVQGISENEIPVVMDSPEEYYSVGDIRNFWIHDTDNNEFIQISAKLAAVSDHAYFWQDRGHLARDGEGEYANSVDWLVASSTFEKSYESVRNIFGNEDVPGIDGDPRVYIIHSDRLGSVGGYFGESHQLPNKIDSHSNEGQYFFISNISI